MSNQSQMWMGVAIIAIGTVTRLLKDDTKIPINIPARWQPVVTLLLGQLYAVLQAVQGGMAWKDAIIQGFQVAFVTMGLFDLVIKALFGGKDMPAPLVGLLKTSGDPNKPANDS